MFLMMKSVLSSSFFASMALRDLQLDFNRVAKVTAKRINAFSRLLPSGKTIAYNSSMVFSWHFTPAAVSISFNFSLMSK